MKHNIFTPGNYFYNGIGHFTVKYWEVLEIGYEGIMRKAEAELASHTVGEADYAERSAFLKAVIISCQAAIHYAGRYAVLAREEAAGCQDPVRKQELLAIAANCDRVPAKPAAELLRGLPVLLVCADASSDRVFRPLYFPGAF